jgi:hypothetical protein
MAEEPCLEGPVEFLVKIVFDRNAKVQDPENPDKFHKLSWICFDWDRPYAINLTPLGELHSLSGEERIKQILDRVNARALLSAALALADAHLEESLLKLSQL